MIQSFKKPWRPAPILPVLRELNAVRNQLIEIETKLPADSDQAVPEEFRTDLTKSLNVLTAAATVTQFRAVIVALKEQFKLTSLQLLIDGSEEDALCRSAENAVIFQNLTSLAMAESSTCLLYTSPSPRD